MQIDKISYSDLTNMYFPSGLLTIFQEFNKGALMVCFNLCYTHFMKTCIFVLSS